MKAAVVTWSLIAWITWVPLAILAIFLAVASSRCQGVDQDRHLPAAAIAIPWLMTLLSWLVVDLIFCLPYALLGSFFGATLSAGMLFSRSARNPRVARAHYAALALNLVSLSWPVLIVAMA